MRHHKSNFFGNTFFYLAVITLTSLLVACGSGASDSGSETKLPEIKSISGREAGK
jgi:hypothetical protein